MLDDPILGAQKAPGAGLQKHRVIYSLRLDSELWALPLMGRDYMARYDLSASCADITDLQAKLSESYRFRLDGELF